MDDPLRVLGEIFTQPLVAEHIRSAPETWIWGLLNSILASVPAIHVQQIPKAILAVVTLLFAVLNPDYQATFVKGPEFYATPVADLKVDYDYIIVGGGTAGCLLANRLSASHSVLLIEAGSTTNILNHIPLLNTVNMQEPSFGLDWLYFSVEQKHAFQRMSNRRTHMGAGRGIGGSSHLNFQIHSRGWDEDYDRWETVYGAKGWNAKEMLHFMKIHERVFEEPLLSSDRHGRDGELSVTISPVGEKRQPVVEAWLEASAKVTSTKVIDDHNSGRHDGFSKIQTTVDPSGRISNSAAAFIDPIRRQRQDTLHIILDTMVDKVLLDDSKIARGVRARSCSLGACSDDTREFTASKDVILSAGTARDPQILMLSGIGPRDELEKHSIPVRVELPGVGANLHDHVLSFGQGLVFPNSHTGGGKGWHDWELSELYNFFTNRSGFFMSPTGSLGVGFIHSPISEDKNRPDLELVAVDMSPAAALAAGAWAKFGLTQEDFLSYIIGDQPQENQDGIILSAILERSRSRGTVRLESANISDRPILDMQYLSDPHDVQVLVEGLRYLRKSAEALSHMGGTPLQSRIPGCTGKLDSDEYLECQVRSFTMSIWHMAGTCRIGARDDPLAVVDNELRVRGVKHLRIVDAAVLPEETTGHMAATIYGVAEKAAHLILQGASRHDGHHEL